jgi:alkanesulfonate monooxygenase SsuD/methylene tetrahydromethanopterin reductase-like flavin-dependent oxidoreductase (luciferase family)
MNLPRIGFNLPTFGPHAGPDGVVAVAKAVEAAGFHSVSATDRLLLPLAEDWDNGAGLPESHVWEPLEMLSWAAAHTSRIRVVCAIVNAIFQPPIVLARRLATLDRLSGGRLDAGLGQGGGGTPETNFLIPQEFTAAGVPVGRRGAGFVEHLAAMRACWGPDPVDFTGKHYRIPLSVVGPKPSGATIPVLFGAVTPRTIERAARLDAGLITVVVGDDGWRLVRENVARYRDVGGTGSVVVPVVRPYPPGGPSRAEFVADALADLATGAAAGADEVHLQLNLAEVPVDVQVGHIEALAERALG